ncbi:Pyroglutamyl-peptidase 1 [Dichotomopilus funicola]|uniref:Pyroglutamyl-peptidase 1 n=1 Tax=Dichotomopilus funicola TaxID=1934379 RepID=A0AAN6UVL0_9PEZI|nr:Pyroglutamyl-peptidase 1 [Dichotomopilus funicola]
MGSVADHEQEPFTVLLTGFAPFKKDYPVNPSWEIVRSLPTFLPPLRAKVPLPTPSSPFPPSTTSTTSPLNPSASPIPPVRLLTHPAPIRVSYQTVRALIPDLWDLDGKVHGDSRPKIDLAVHVGMAGPRLFYSLERRGHREGYRMPDVDGGVLGDDGEKGEKGKWIWEGMPEELETAVDVGDVLGRWKGHSPKHLDLRVSEDAGHYLCDFIYFSSLAHLEKAGERRRVVFLHVPSDASEHSIAVGREVLLQLVRALVESEVARRERERSERQ